MATRNICTYPMESALGKEANAIIEQGGKLKRVNLDWEFDKKANAIVSEADGAVITVNDSSMARPKNLILCGKSTQKTTTGKNLLQNNIYDMEHNGIKITKNADKTFYVNGTATDSCYFTLNSGVELPEGRYILSGCDSGGSPSKYILYATTDEGFYTQDVGNGIEFNYSSETPLPIRMAVYKGTVMNNVLIKPMLRSAEIEDDTYEPYTGGQASPNPDYPQEIVSVESPNVVVHGKNFLKPKVKTETVNGITITIGEDGIVTVNGTATKAAFFGLCDLTLKPGEKYVLSGCDGGGFDTYMLYLHYKESGYDVYNRTGETNFVARDEAFSAVVVVYEGTTVNNMVLRPMIRHVSYESNEFESCKEAQTIPLTHTLHGIPVKSGGNHTDADGQQWICDEIDLERGVLIQRVKELVLNGSENWLISSGIYLYLDLEEHAIKGREGFCSHFDFWYNYGGDCVFASEKWLYLGKVASDKYGLNVAAWKKFLASNNMTVCYALAEPIETPLTDAEIYAFKHTEMNYPNTTILNDAGAFMKLDYFADTLKFVLKNGGGFSTVSKFEMSLPASGWKTASDNTYYYQVVTVPGATEDSKIDLQPTPAQLISLLNNGTSMFAANEGGTITVYVIGSKPTTDMTIQATKMEVVYV